MEGEGGYGILLYPVSGHPRFSGGHLEVRLQWQNYSEFITLRTPFPVSLKSHRYFKVEQFFFEAGWDWGMNGFLEGRSRKLTHKGLYQ